MIDVSSRKFVEVELGCAGRKRHPSAIGVDIISDAGVDIQMDILEFLKKLPSESVDKYYSYHVLEHLKNLSEIMSEIQRTLKKNGEFHCVVPHFSNPYYYSDPTHVQPFGLYTFSYLTVNNKFKRDVPSYIRNNELILSDIHIVFKSPRIFIFRNIIRRVFGLIINLGPYLQEFYEENLTWLVSAYEIKVKVVKDQRDGV